MKKIQLAAIVSLLAIFAVRASAGEGKWSAAIGGGLLMEEKHSGVATDEGMLAGIEIARSMGEKLDLSFGFAFARSEKESDLLPGTKFKFNNYFGTLCASYKLDGIAKGLYLGPQVAVVTRSLTSVGASSGDSIGMTSFGYGARAGYDYSLSEKFLVGVQGNYLKAGKADKTVKEGAPLVDVTYSVPETSFTSLLFSVKYRF